MRNLVSIQEVKGILPIPDADAIEVIEVLGWKLVVKKDEFKVGDKVVYFEVDSFLPIEDKYEFLRKSSFKNHPTIGEGFRIKTIKLRGQISQGLALAPSDLGLEDLPVGTDVTDRLGVRKWEPIETLSDWGAMREGLPDGVSKTDETRIQSIYDEIMPQFEGRRYYISTKIDGTSITMLRQNGEFKVCSHCNEILDNAPSSIWDYARKHNVEQKMINADINNYAFQGEMAGPGIQKNRLNLTAPKWFIFTIKNLATGQRLGLEEMKTLCDKVGLEMVPIEEEGDNLIEKYPTLETLLERAKGKYASGQNKEGIVIRPVEPIHSNTVSGPLSFKVLNNDYLLKEK